MEKITSQKHSKEAFFYSLSRILERASYFGFRIIIILYMTSEGLNMSREETLSVYGWFSFSVIFFQIIGALMGDLVIGNKKSIILGAVLQTIGVFSLFISSTTGLYIGLTLVALGNGLYSPNIIANFGKLYLSKSKLMDSGFTMLYLAVNLGAFLGTALIGIAATRYGWNMGFIIAGIVMLFSIIPVLILKEKKPNELSNNIFILKKKSLKYCYCSYPCRCILGHLHNRKHSVFGFTIRV